MIMGPPPPPPPHSGGGTSSSSSSSSSKPPPEIDSFLSGAGYKVRSSDLRHVAHRLERLESAMSDHPSDLDSVHFNPSDIGSWVDSILSDLDAASHPPKIDAAAVAEEETQVLVSPVDEDSEIRLVHTLMSCAESVQRGDLPLAASLVADTKSLLAVVNTGSGIGKVAGHFIDALSRRIFCPSPSAAVGSSADPFESEILYHHYYEACPYLKFAHFTANQAILEAFDGHDCVHVVDFNLMHGLQWPALIQALALRPGGPPLLRLTGVGPPSPDGRDSLREIGLRLAHLARSLNVRFAFRGVAASRLQDVKPWMLQVSPNEAVAVNSIMQLHRLLGPDSGPNPAIDIVLGWIRGLRPKIMTVVEQEARHNQEGFLERFTESLHYYSSVFDSLDQACSVEAEMYLQREIENVVSCEGAARVERHEPLAMWKTRLEGAGFRTLPLGSNAFKQATMLLTLFSPHGYCVEEREGCLMLGWHARPLVAASAWQALPPPDHH